MPALSKKQQKFFGIVRAIQKGEQVPTTPETAKAAADMKKGDVKKFASTKHKGLPEKKVAKEEYGNPKVGPALKMARLIDKTKPGPKSKRTKISQYLKRREMDGDKKKFAAMGEDVKISEDKQIKKIVKQLRKSVKSHAKQADTLEKKIAEESNPRIPRKKGQPANSKKHSDLYTDENPKGTIHGLGFKDVATAKASVTKIRGSSRSHAHKIQAAVAMEQRAREMGKTSEAAVYRKFINSMKKKTKKMNEEKSGDHEPEMIRSQLKTAGRASKRIEKHSRKKDNFKAWVQSKITKASDYLDTAADYLDSKDVKKEAANPAQQAAIAINMKKKGKKPKDMNEGSLHKWFKGSKSKDGKGGWVNVVTGGTCASDEPGEGTPKCVSSAKRASMTKAERLSAARRKKKADPGQQSKTGAAKPTYVSTDSPRKKKMKEETQLNEVKDKKGKGSGKKDACYHKVKSRYSVWPSAYASGALVKCRKVGAANWGNSSKKEEFEPTGISFQQFQEKCWKGYEKKGMKTMFGKRYPNCVKKEEVEVVNEVSDKLKKNYIKGATKDIEKLRKTGKTPSGELDTPSADKVIKRKVNIGKTMASIKEAKYEAGASTYGKASIRNKRRFGTKGENPDPLTGKKITKDATRGELITKRREEHKAKRGVKDQGEVLPLSF